MFVDTHAHVIKKYYDDVDKVIDNSKEQGVNLILNVGTCDEEFIEIKKQIEKYDNVFGVIGYYPNNIDKINNLNNLEENLKNKNIVALGEIGLEYCNLENKEEQKVLFEQQIELALNYDLPIVVHSRDAINDTYEILKKYSNRNLRGVIHCYSGSYEMAKEFIKLGFYLGVGGVYTFKNNKKGIEILEKIDLKYLVLETDSPYLTPEPFRGKKNTPEYIPYVAAKVAQIKQIPIEDVMEVTTNNALNLFGIKISKD